MEVITKGSVEPLMVALRDRLNNVDDLTVVSGKLYSVKKKSDDSAVQTNQTWVVDPDFPMYALCMIDTTLAAYTPGDTYKLYVKWDESGSQVVKGPLYFNVESD